MSSSVQRQQRISSLRKRIAGPQDAYGRCRVYPCTNSTTADRGEGLNRLYCRKHIEFYRRHGSYVKRSYSAGELRPYRVEALAWLQAHSESQSVQLAVAGVRSIYAAAGVALEAFRLSGRSPTDRARAIWALLRKRDVDPLDVLSLWIAIDQRLRHDPQPDRHEEYRHVQVAKLVHRMAGGTHKRWERERADGSMTTTELHRYPVSRGRVLRVVGRQLAEACGAVGTDDIAIPRIS